MALIRQAILTLVHALPLLPFFNQVEPGGAPKQFIPSRSQQRFGAALEPLFLCLRVSSVSVETRKTGCRLRAGPELTLELLWWKRGIGPLTGLTDLTRNSFFSLLVPPSSVFKKLNDCPVYHVQGHNPVWQKHDTQR